MVTEPDCCARARAMQGVCHVNMVCKACATHWHLHLLDPMATHDTVTCTHCAKAMAREVHEQGYASTVPEQGEGGPMHVACHDEGGVGEPRCPDTSISETTTTTTSFGTSPCTNFSVPDPELSDAVLDYYAAMPPAQAKVTGLGPFWDGDESVPMADRVYCLDLDKFKADPPPQQPWVLNRKGQFLLFPMANSLHALFPPLLGPPVDPSDLRSRFTIYKKQFQFDAAACAQVEPEFYFYDPHPELESNWSKICFQMSTILRRFRTLFAAIFTAIKEF